MNKKDVSIIITLYKTPVKRLKSLNQYRKYPIMIFDQEPEDNSKEKISKILNLKFDYYYSKKNIGNSKSTNFLLKKVKTKYCLFTQADITIDKTSLNNLIVTIKKNKDVIFAGPVFKKKTKVRKKNNSQNYEINNHLNASCMLCDVKKVKKIGFFDEDFFLYWNDEDLMKRVNKTNFKMIKVLNSFANHESSQSSINITSTDIIRSMHFKCGELIFDYKYNKLRFIKIFRQLITNFIFLFINSLLFSKQRLILNYANLLGITIFLKFYLRKKLKLL